MTAVTYTATCAICGLFSDQGTDQQPLAAAVSEHSAEAHPGVAPAITWTSDDPANKVTPTIPTPPTAEEVAAKNQTTLLAQRNRWLFETDPYNLAGGAIADMPPAVQQAVQENLEAIQAWRQQLRDWPDTVSDWTNPPALPAAPAINLPSGAPLFRLT